PQREPVLATDEAEAVTKFENELLQPRRQPVLQFALLHAALQPEELQMVAAFEHLVRLLGQRLRQGGFKVVRFPFRQRTLVSAGFHLMEQHIPGPSESGGSAEVVKEFVRVFDFAEQMDMMTPRNRADQFS